MKKLRAVLGVILVLVIGGALIARTLVFPLKYKAEIQKYAKEYNVEPELIAAVIHVRSAFAPKEYEIGKECGPMSLQDKSAQFIAKEMGLKEFKAENLADPDLNIKMGTWFMAKSYRDKNIESLVEKLGGMNWQDAAGNKKQEEKKFWEDYYKQYFTKKIESRMKIYKLLYPTL
ncbi:transglycosylase SLT domain-containing protein [Haloimpatiens sp. FM7315]|uniref:transglycosylase SLT domain-containing protein n=1 Tax=Haloimpatiens sp. FM7315 TaxID=3298609 RepID=UPI00370BCC91